MCYNFCVLFQAPLIQNRCFVYMLGTRVRRVIIGISILRHKWAIIVTKLMTCIKNYWLCIEHRLTHATRSAVQVATLPWPASRLTTRPPRNTSGCEWNHCSCTAELDLKVHWSNPVPYSVTCSSLYVQSKVACFEFSIRQVLHAGPFFILPYRVCNTLYCPIQYVILYTAIYSM